MINVHPLHLFSERQRGTALVMALVLLLVLTILGVSAMSTTALQEKMAANTKDRNTAFQAAESALLRAENWVFEQIGKPVFPNNAVGLYVPSTTATPVWESVVWTGTTNLVVYPGTPTASASGGLAMVSVQPKYVIEDLGEVQDEGGSLALSTNYKSKGKTIVRITAYGTGGTTASVVMLQSTYGRYF